MMVEQIQPSIRFRLSAAGPSLQGLIDNLRYNRDWLLRNDSEICRFLSELIAWSFSSQLIRSISRAFDPDLRHRLHCISRTRH